MTDLRQKAEMALDALDLSVGLTIIAVRQALAERQEPKREWVGLTDDDISKAKTLLKDNDSEYAIFFIMTRLQEYNT